MGILCRWVLVLTLLPAAGPRLWAASEETLAGYREAYWRRVKAFGVEPDGKAVIDVLPLGGNVRHSHRAVR